MLLAALDPTLKAERYSITQGTEPILREGEFALVREEEGLTLIREDPSGDWARISLGVHSSLDAVGLTSVLSSRLAKRGISANILAGYYHDHLFIPWDRREEALECLGRA